MSLRLPLVDAPPLDTVAESNGARRAVRVACVAIVPARDRASALSFAEHLVRAARVAGARPVVLLTERAERGAELSSADPVTRVRFIDAGAHRVTVSRCEAALALASVRTFFETEHDLVVGIGADVVSSIEPTFSIALSDGRPLTTWTAMARSVRGALDAELTDPRSEFARGLVSALDRYGLLRAKPA